MPAALPPLRVVLVGVGVIAAVHAEVIAGLDRLEVTAIVSPSRVVPPRISEQLRSASRPRPAVFASLDEALRHVAVDVVVLATPTGTHASLAMVALRGGAHVIIEKPLDVHIERAREVLAVARDRPEQTVSVISQKRFEPASEFVKDVVSAGRIGSVTSVSIVGALWRSQNYYDSGEWRGTWEMDGGGALMNQGIHSVDLLTWFFGAPAAVAATTSTIAHTRIEVEDTVSAVLRYPSGASATLLYSTAAYPGLSPRISVHGDRGSVVVEADRVVYYHSADDASPVGDYGARIQDEPNLAPRLLEGALTSESVRAETFAHRRQYLDFIAAVDGRGNSCAPLEDAFLSLATVGAIYESARQRTWLSFDGYLQPAATRPTTTKGSR